MRPKCSLAVLMQCSMLAESADSHSFTAAAYSASVMLAPSFTVSEESAVIATLAPLPVGRMFTMHFPWAVPVSLSHLASAAPASASDIAVDRYVCEP